MLPMVLLMLVLHRGRGVAVLHHVELLHLVLRGGERGSGGGRRSSRALRRRLAVRVVGRV